MAGTCSTQNGLLRRSRTAKLVVQTLYKRIGDSIFKARERSELFNLKTAKRFNLKPLSDHRELLRKETLMKLEIRTWKCQKELPSSSNWKPYQCSFALVIRTCGFVSNRRTSSLSNWQPIAPDLVRTIIVLQLYELQFVRTEIPVKREPFRKGVKKRSCVTLVRTKIPGTVCNLILKSIWNLHKSQASLPEILTTDSLSTVFIRDY